MDGSDALEPVPYKMSVNWERTPVEKTLNFKDAVTVNKNPNTIHTAQKSFS